MATARTQDGVRLHYELHDYTDPWKNAPVLILQHGFGRSSRFWYNVVPHLARYYKVVCPDLRGLGQSTEGFSLDKGGKLEHYIADLVAIVDATGQDRVHYAGESLGGALGFAFAALHPERVRTLSVFGAPLRLGPDIQAAQAAGFESWEQALRELGPLEWARKTAGSMRFPGWHDPAMMEWFNQEMGKNSTDGLVALLRLASGIDATPLLERIQAPVLALYPSQGSTVEKLGVIRERVKNLRVIVVPSLDHMIQFMQPGVCARHVLYFMANHDGIACAE